MTNTRTAAAKADAAKEEVTAPKIEVVKEEKNVPEVKEAAKEVAQVKTNDEIRKEEEVSSLIYCGPSLRSNALQQYAIFTSDVPAHVAPHLEKCPAIKALMVPVSEMNTCISNIATQGTAEQVLYNQIQQYVRGE